MIKLKICGMQTVADVELCANAGADALGFIFADGPRRLSPAQAAPLTRAVASGVGRVGVFADSPRELIEQALSLCDLDVLQFAGAETPEFCGSFGLPTLLVARTHAPAADVIARARAIAVIADARTAGLHGGTGIRVNDELASRIRSGSGAPFILAGGLTPDNVAHAIRSLRPNGVDVRSGVERNGRKDPELVGAFAAAVMEAYDVARA
jgi:phosphoribosylanthranilate isomerase